jgi:hypothetical protein
LAGYQKSIYSLKLAASKKFNESLLGQLRQLTACATVHTNLSKVRLGTTKDGWLLFANTY